jgi:hypothetical protein
MFRYTVYHNHDPLAGFNHRPDAEAFQRNRCEGLGVSIACYPIVDEWLPLYTAEDAVEDGAPGWLP